MEMGGISKSFVNGFNKPFIFCLLLELTICLQNMIDLFIIGRPLTGVRGGIWQYLEPMENLGANGRKWGLDQKIPKMEIAGSSAAEPDPFSRPQPLYANFLLLLATF